MNDDLISRQRLLKKLKHHKELFCRNRIEFLGLSKNDEARANEIAKNDKARENEIDNCIATVINMPPVQPEQRSFSCGKENDLISRRAAIDKLDPIFESLAIDKIKALPTALPEIIRCKDCKHYIPYDWMFSGLSRSSNINNYFPDDMVCLVNDDNYPPDGFCSKSERRTDEVD